MFVYEGTKIIGNAWVYVYGYASICTWLSACVHECMFLSMSMHYAYTSILPDLCLGEPYLTEILMLLQRGIAEEIKAWDQSVDKETGPAQTHVGKISSGNQTGMVYYFSLVSLAPSEPLHSDA